MNRKTGGAGSEADGASDAPLMFADTTESDPTDAVPFLARFARRKHAAPTPRGETTATRMRETSDE